MADRQRDGYSPSMTSIPKLIGTALALAMFAVALLPAPVARAAEGDVVTLRVRGEARLRALILRPDRPPVATVLLYAGGNGNLGIASNGSIKNAGNFLVRSRDLFVKQGFLVAVVDRPSDWAGADAETFRMTKAHVEDAAAIVRLLRERTPAPVWFVGTSRGTISVANIASRLGRDRIAGIVLTSSVTRAGKRSPEMVTDADLSGIAVPVLILGHGEDGCRVTPWPEQEALKDRFSNSPSVEAVRIDGGDAGDTRALCGPFSHHGYLGQEDAVVARIADWIKAHGPRR